jgi:hypothetical protein
MHYLVELQPGVHDFAGPVSLKVLPGDVVHDGPVAALVVDEVDVVTEVAERRERNGVLQVGHARRLAELGVVLVVVHHHVHRRCWAVGLAGCCICPREWKKLVYNM